MDLVRRLEPTSPVSPLTAAAAASLLALTWFPRPLFQAAPALVWVLLVLILCVAAAAAEASGRHGSLARACLVFGVPAGLFIAGVLTLSVNAEKFSAGVFLTCIIPITLLAGPAIARSQLLPTFLRWNIPVAAAVIVPLAIVEAISGRGLFGPSLIDEDGHHRAMVGSEHAIVLGTLLAATIGSAIMVRSRVSRILLIGWLTLGIYTTYSQGPMATVILIVVLLVSRRVRGFVTRHALAMVALAAAAVSWISMTFPSDHIPGKSVFEYSSFYRGTLYAQIPKLLAQAPLGFGVEPVPSGLMTASSDLLGMVDLGVSTDSEIVLWVERLGILGIALFAAGLYVALRGTSGRRSAMHLYLLAILLNGFTVALTAWMNLALLIPLMLGACLARPGSARILSVNSVTEPRLSGEAPTTPTGHRAAESHATGTA